MPMKIVIGTRRSSLALVQSRAVARPLEAAGAEVKIRPIKTIGDTLDVALSELGGEGVFIKEIDEALLNGGVDVAVHSMEDVPARLPQGIAIAAVTPREDPREAFISTRAFKLSGLSQGARVGTSSPRRRAQLFRIRPDLDVVPVKGNVETRLKKLEAGKVDALILAAADLKRLGIGNVITECLPVDRMIPAVGQGALAVEVRGVDRELVRFVHKSCHHAATGIAIRAERSFLKVVGGDSNDPIAAYGEIRPSGLVLAAFMSTKDESHYVIDRESGPVDEAAEIGRRLGERMLKKLGVKES